ncbi:alpha/beta fold hydrolase [Arenibaculum pallidiluteum]|uniref:alpha/beta fold hydrolase n=1 Tax=Arenibaculum pallidiluteum TaxID=2812559 RepID=UPI001A97B4CB|nr:alpha/beta fold hydrolase [Arenibaculum pallidiluteum]
MSARIRLVLLPGLLCDAELWAHQTAHLSEVAEPVVVRTDLADSVGELAEAVLRAVPGRFALAGLSMGGYVSLEILRRAPDRVAKLALLDTNARADTPEQTERRRALLDISARGGFDRILPALLPSFLHPARLEDAGLVARMKAMAGRVGPDGFARQQAAIIARPDSWPGLPQIACPTLVLCGRQDPLSDVAVHAEMADMIPGARLAVIEDCGHMATMEQPQAATVLMRDWILYA